MSRFPVLDRPPVVIPMLVGALEVVWQGIVELAGAVEVPWTIVGGQMVLLHGLEHGATPPRVSDDIDAAVDVRADPAAVQKLTATLLHLGFDSAGESPEGHAYRFVKQVGEAVATIDVSTAKPSGLQVDVLVSRRSRRTGGHSNRRRRHRLPSAGVTQALARTELVPVHFDSRHVLVPRPSLLGALVLKAAASVVDPSDQDRHRSDLAFLCGLVEDPFAMRELLTKKDLQRLRLAGKRFPPEHPAWRDVDQPDAARATLAILLDDQ